MIDERRKEQATLYALGSLPNVEVAEFERAKQSDLDLELLVAELQSSLDTMVFAFPRVAAPEELRQNILNQLDQRETAGYRWLTFPLGAWRQRLWLPWALAAALALFGLVYFYANRDLHLQVAALNEQIAALDQQVIDLNRQSLALNRHVEALTLQAEELGRQRDTWRNQGDQKYSELQQQLADLQKRLLQSAEELQTGKAAMQHRWELTLADFQKEKAALQDQIEETADENQRLAAALEAAQAELLEAKNRDALAQIRVGMLTSLMNNAPKAIAASVWDSEQQKGLLEAANLPPLAADQVYQLWLIDLRYPNPISAGVFDVDQQGGARFQFKTDFRVESVEKFAVTLERKGGVVRPQGKTVLVSN